MAAIESNKHVAIVKANAQAVIVVAVASFISVFCLMASQTLWKQNAYQSRVIAAKEKAHNQLKNNLTAANALTDSYTKFTSGDHNVIGGSTTGSGDNDGDNAKIVLDALPSSYDFPALASSLEKILKDHSIDTGNIGGTDDELAQQVNTSSPTPQAVPMNFTLGVSAVSYNSVQDLVSVLQRSIRPIQIDTLDLNGSNSSMSLNITAHTYYQPPKNLSIVKQAVK